MIYDLIVVGNGLAAQTFLFELFKNGNVKKSQNFSVAQIFSEDIAASCSLRTTASVSLFGIEEGVSDLGNELHQSFLLFQDFYQKYKPDGVEALEQVITYSSEKEKAKMLRRFKVLKTVNHSILKNEVEGTNLNSYIIDPSRYSAWFDKELANNRIVKMKKFVKKLSIDVEGVINCELTDQSIQKARKVVLCTGAYAKLFTKFFENTESILEKTEIVPGSFLERSVDYNCPSFYFTINQHNLIYRSSEKKLILGSVTPESAISLPAHDELNELLSLFSSMCNLPLGSYSDFKVITGLRLKGWRRRPIGVSLDNKNLFMINGLYKNGYTFPHLLSKKIVSELDI